MPKALARCGWSQGIKSHEGNWIPAMPGKRDNVLLRLCGPRQPWFDKAWKTADFEEVK
jgi:hypothetical protein